MGRKYRLAILTSHPIQYQVPLFRCLANDRRIDLMVYYCCDWGVKEKRDPGFGVSFKWDLPLLEGYASRFLRNFSPWKSPIHFGGLANVEIVKVLSQLRYDAILIHGYASLTAWLAFVAARKSKTSILFRGETVLRENERAWQDLAKRLVLGWGFRRIDAFLAIGTKSRDFYIRYGVPRHRIFLAPYAVDNEYFMAQAELWKGKREEIKEELGIPAKVPVVLYASKLTARKRPDELLRAFAKVSSCAVLIFVGDGELRGALEEYRRQRNIPNVLFVGFKNQSELPRYYSIADMFALPSSYEPWGLVVNEAMCFGLPIITTDQVAAAADLVRDGENGFIYPAGRVDHLGEALSYLVENPNRCREMGRRSFELVGDWNYPRCSEAILAALEYVKESNRK